MWVGASSNEGASVRHFEKDALEGGACQEATWLARLDLECVTTLLWRLYDFGRSLHAESCSNRRS